MPKQKGPGAQADVPESSPAIGAVRFSVPLTLPSAGWIPPGRSGGLDLLLERCGPLAWPLWKDSPIRAVSKTCGGAGCTLHGVVLGI
jgi:hypothetical protein